MKHKNKNKQKTLNKKNNKKQKHVRTLFSQKTIHSTKKIKVL